MYNDSKAFELMPYSIQLTRIEGFGELSLCTKMDNQRSRHKLILAILQKNQASIADHENVKLENIQYDSIDLNNKTLLKYSLGFCGTISAFSITES